MVSIKELQELPQTKAIKTLIKKQGQFNKKRREKNQAEKRVDYDYYHLSQLVEYQAPRTQVTRGVTVRNGKIWYVTKASKPGEELIHLKEAPIIKY
jgi:hypothetical protein